MKLKVQFSSDPTIHEILQWNLPWFQNKVYKFTSGNLSILQRYLEQNSEEWGFFCCETLEDVSMMAELHHQHKYTNFDVPPDLLIEWARANPAASLEPFSVNMTIAKLWLTKDIELINRFSFPHIHCYWPENRELEEYICLVTPDVCPRIEDAIFADNVVHHFADCSFLPRTYSSIRVYLHLRELEKLKDFSEKLIFELGAEIPEDDIIERLKILAETHVVEVVVDRKSEFKNCNARVI